MKNVRRDWAWVFPPALALCLGIAMLMTYGEAVEPLAPPAAALGLNQAHAAQADLTLAAIAPDGQTLALVNPQGRVELRAVTDGRLLARAPARDGSHATGVAFAPDGQTLAALADDGRVDLWRLPGLKRRGLLAGHDGARLSRLVFAPRTRLIATAASDQRVNLWDANTGELRHSLPGHAGAAILALSFAPEGTRLASLGDNGEAILWNTARGQPLIRITGLAPLADALAFSDDGNTIFALREDGQAGLWDSRTGQSGPSLADPERPRLTGFAYAGGILAGVGEDHSVRLWDSRSGGPRHTLTLPEGIRPQALALTPSGGQLAVADANGGWRLWDTQSGTAGAESTWTAPLSALAYGPDGKLLLGRSADGRILVRAANGTEHTLAGLAPATSGGALPAPANTANAASAVADPPPPSIPPTAPDRLRNATTALQRSVTGRIASAQHRAWRGASALAVSPDGSLVGTASADGEVRIDSNTGTERFRVHGHHGQAVTAVAFSHDGGRLFSAGHDSEIAIWNTTTGLQEQRLRGPEHPLRTLADALDGTVAAAGEDTRIMVWNPEGRLVRILSGHRDFVNGLAFSPDGKYLASCSADTRIILWDMGNGQIIRTLPGGTGLNAVSFSPDGKQLAVAGADSQVQIWEVATGQRLAALTGHNAPVRGLAFSADGQSLASGGEDARTLVWDMGSGKLRKILTGRRMINGVAFGRGGEIYAADEGGKVVEWNPRNGRWRDLIVLPPRPNGAARQSAPDILGRVLDWLIPAANAAIPAPPHGPILVVVPGTTGFGTYYPEILRAEGFNAFDVQTLGNLSTADLNSHDLVILAPTALSAAQVSLLTNWVNSGGNLIAMRPDVQLAGLLGLTATGTPLAEGYLAIDTGRTPGSGIVGQPLQFHGSADRYTLNGATAIATLYSDFTTATPHPAVTLRNAGSGRAAAFLYDLASSVVYTRQGNPNWATQERDGFAPIRSDDKFFGAASGDPQPDWVDLVNELAIPQADEQQRLLANLIVTMNLAQKPLPRFWYFPFAKKAVVVMTGDDHANGGTAGRFDQFLAMSPAHCVVQNWECVRGTSYIYPDTPLSDAQAQSYTSQGFEVGLHISTDCADYTPAALENFYSQQIAQWTARYPGIPQPQTERHHCIAWSDWVTAAKTQLTHGIRLDTSYYFWPPGWVQDWPGTFNGSALPMRFADSDGTLLDVYNATTHMTDESGQSYPLTIDTLLDRALGATGFYGAYVINAHTDLATQDEATFTVNSALSRGVPVVSSAQMLTWLDARGGSSFGNIAWSNNALTFSVTPGSGATGLTALLPSTAATGTLRSLTRNGVNLAFTTQTLKGLSYAVFPVANGGNYVATYAADTTPPTVTATVPANNATEVAPGSPITASFSEALDPASVNGGTFTLQGAAGAVTATVSYDPATHTAILTPAASLAFNASYSASLQGGGTDPRIKDLAGNALTTSPSWSFTTAAAPSCPCSLWPTSTVPAHPVDSDPSAVELGMKFRADVDGVITGLRFYKGVGNNGPHTGTLWDNAGRALASVNFGAETAAGWQQATFATPVAITANTVYVASYHAPVGHYAGDNGYFANAVDNSPLHALADGVAGGNGVYLYGPGGFPSNSYQASNYWVDVLFTPGAAPPPPPPPPPGTPSTLFGTATPGTIDAPDSGALELGIRFRAETAGKILGIRYYKSAANTGSHTGHLWTATGTLLASVTFTGETTSGWQRADFATPVTITANTDYIASYHTDTGHYSVNQNFFTGGIDNAPLHAPADGAGGLNGVFVYSGQSQFPNQSFRASNYWVDVVFSSD